MLRAAQAKLRYNATIENFAPNIPPSTRPSLTSPKPILSLRSINSPKTTTNFTNYSETNADDEALYIRAAERIISLQIKAGVDIPTDGEVRRENYIHYHWINGHCFYEFYGYSIII